ncbi:MAG TPA: antitoxin Xre/MbcA/ParS toxin-binding domain-containing protein [Longimicrobium sp.]|jgi:putative toxin-antitoxin system antitoxin component (TIGR02293 family)
MHAIAEKLGGARVLQRDIRSDLELAEVIHAGFPIRVVDFVLKAGLLDASELYGLVIPRRTLAHRKEKQNTLSREQSDRLARVVRVLVRAEEALGTVEKAARWLRKENRALGGKRPIELLESDTGARVVERILGRIEHGVYS